MKDNGGIIGPIIAVPTTGQTGAAGGIWSLPNQQQNAATWPVFVPNGEIMVVAGGGGGGGGYYAGGGGAGGFRSLNRLGLYVNRRRQGRRDHDFRRDR